VSSLLLICIPGNKTKCYEDLLDLISRPSEEPFYILHLNLYAEIIPNLVKLLDKHGINVSSSPSREFFCYIIGTYLQEVLGSKEGSPCLEFFMFTCGHEACSRVNDFLRSEERKTTVPLEDVFEDCLDCSHFGERYRILQGQINRRSEPPLVILTKLDEAVAARGWGIRLADAQSLLKTIGTDKDISQIMREQYQDVVKALEGSQPFVVAETRREEAGEGMVMLSDQISVK